MAVSRLDCNVSVSAQYWNFEQDTIPNGTIDLASRSSHFPGSGRVLILFYNGEHNTAITGSMTIGGVAPSFEYKNTYDLGVDLQSYVGIWLDADIEAMSGSTATTNGTWPSTTSEVWGYNMYMNVDQDKPLVLGENYTEHGSITSPTQFSVVTTGGSDDLILVLGGSNSSATNLSSYDTLYRNVDTDDDVGNNMRYYVLEGPAGDNSTQVGPNNTGSHFTYGLVLKYRRYALRLEARDYRTDTTDFTSVYTPVRVPDLEISANQTTPSREYFACVQGSHSANTSAVAFGDHNMYQNGISNIQETETNNRESRRTGVNSGHQHFAFSRETMAGTGTYVNNRDFRHSNRGNGTDGIRNSATDMLLIDLSDLVEGDEYIWDYDATSYTALDNVSWTEGASVTIPHSGDWLVFAYAHIIVDSTNADILFKVTTNDTDNGSYLYLEGEDSTEEFCHGYIVALEGLSAGDVLKAEFQTASATAGLMDVDANKIFALHMDIFDDHFIEYEPDDTTISAGDTDNTVATANWTTNLSQDTDYLVGAVCIHDVADSAARCSARIDDTDSPVTTIAGGIDESWHQNGTSDRVPLGPIWKMYTGQTDGTAKTFELIVNEEEGAIALGTIVDSWMWGFTPVFARNKPHEVFYNRAPSVQRKM